LDGISLKHPLEVLEKSQVAIWHIPLAQNDATIRACRSLLPPDEIERADRFYFEKDRRHFAVAHGALRQILARYTGADPREIEFSFGSKGKPDLKSPVDTIKFNLSHSGNLALLAVTREAILGVDVEFIKTDFGGQEIAERFFSRHEVSTLLALPMEERAHAFFSCWTRKEAYIKAVGEGLSLPLDSFDVAFGPGIHPALLRVEASAEELLRWRLYDIEVPPEYRAALMVEGRQHQLQQRQWKLEF
jgi:4'-phosphopantetheinyl transferase